MARFIIAKIVNITAVFVRCFQCNPALTIYLLTRTQHSFSVFIARPNNHVVTS